jgi:hypothetical protein
MNVMPRDITVLIRYSCNDVLSTELVIWFLRYGDL